MKAALTIEQIEMGMLNMTDYLKSHVIFFKTYMTYYNFLVNDEDTAYNASHIVLSKFYQNFSQGSR